MKGYDTPVSMSIASKGSSPFFLLELTENLAIKRLYSVTLCYRLRF